jgi:hypothetical protein
VGKDGTTPTSASTEAPDVANERDADVKSSRNGAADDLLYSKNDQNGPHVSDRDHHADAGDYPVVSGTAARGLFGDTGDDTDLRARDKAAAGGADRSRPAPTALRRPGRGPRRASLQIKRFDPWSVLKLSLVLGVAMFFVWLVAVGVLYTVLDGMGVWDKLNGTYSRRPVR